MKHFGKEERILIEKKNFEKELEDVPEIGGDPHDIKAEHILSVNEQIKHVTEHKHPSKNEQFYDLVKGTLNPFLDANFNKEQLSAASNPEI